MLRVGLAVELFLMKRDKGIIVKGVKIGRYAVNNTDYISLTDMLKAKDGDFFISDWLRNRNTVEFLGIWEQVNNPDFNYGEFAIIRSQAGLNMSDDEKSNLEKQLWAVANILRGRMNADEYNNYILGLIFYKCLSEKLAKDIKEFESNEKKFQSEIAKFCEELKIDTPF